MQHRLVEKVDHALAIVRAATVHLIELAPDLAQHRHNALVLVRVVVEVLAHTLVGLQVGPPLAPGVARPAVGARREQQPHRRLVEHDWERRCGRKTGYERWWRGNTLSLPLSHCLGRCRSTFATVRVSKLPLLLQVAKGLLLSFVNLLMVVEVHAAQRVVDLQEFLRVVRLSLKAGQPPMSEHHANHQLALQLFIV